MNWWFITLLMLYALELGTVTAKNGQEKTGKYSVGGSLFGAIIGLCIVYMAIKTGF